MLVVCGDKARHPLHVVESRIENHHGHVVGQSCVNRFAQRRRVERGEADRIVIVSQKTLDDLNLARSVSLAGWTFEDDLDPIFIGRLLRPASTDFQNSCPVPLGMTAMRSFLLVPGLLQPTNAAMNRIAKSGSRLSIAIVSLERMNWREGISCEVLMLSIQLDGPRNKSEVGSRRSEVGLWLELLNDIR